MNWTRNTATPYEPGDAPDPIWQTVDANGNVTGVWTERGSYTAEAIREYAARYQPGDSLRVTRFTATTTPQGTTT